MKRFSYWSLCIWIGIIILTSYCFAAEGNLIVNGGFEETNAPWINHVWDATQGVTEFGSDKQEKHSGTQSLFITNNLENDARYKQLIPVEGGAYYHISCYVKTQGVPKGSKGANISIEAITETSRDVFGTTQDWELIELYGITEANQKEMVVTVGLGGYGYTNTGKAWFDDVVVEKIDTLPAGVPPVNLYRNVETEKKDAKNFTLVYILIVIAVIYLLYWLFIKKSKLDLHEMTQMTHEINNNKQAPEKMKLSKTDYVLMFGMTCVYLLLALYNLGTTKMPQTEWTPRYSGETFTVAFDQPTDLTRITFFSALGDDRESKGIYQVEYLNSNQQFVKIEPITKEEIFKWDYNDTGKINTTQIKFTVEDAGGTINELGFFNGTTQMTQFKVVNQSSQIGTVENLFDEQDTVVYQPSYMNGTYFDEIYFARTAYEHLHGITAYENTHPPLGKLFIALGISIFGMNTFGWRIIGTLFGVAMIPVMYLFGKKMFGKTFYGFCAAFLMMFDFMHFTQTRISTIDGYSTLFIMLMYYFMYDYFVNKSYQMDFKKTLTPLLFSGLCFGLGVASKWICLYGGAGLAILFFWSRYSETQDYLKQTRNFKANKEPWTQYFIPLNINATLIACVGFFIVIPLVIYCLSYLPMLSLPRDQWWVTEIINYQKHMFNYHSTLKATHPFSSPWYEWPIIKRPTWYYDGSGLAQGMRSTIAVLGNPAIWWTGLVTIWLSIEIAISKKDKKMMVIFIAMLCQYLPWVFVTRITWIYHYFSTTPFMMLTIVYVIKNLIENVPRSKYWIYAYLGLVFVMFIAFYPVLSGKVVSGDYIEALKWFKSWTF